MIKCCKYCSTEFETPRKDRVFYCSRRCGALNNSKLMSINCLECKQIFRQKYKDHAYCSLSCRATNVNKNRGQRSQSTKDKISSSLKLRNKDSKTTDNAIKSHKCSICSAELVGNKNIKTCSPICAEKSRRKTYSSNRKNHKPMGGIRNGSGRGKSGWYDDTFFNSTYELAYYLYCKDHNISIVRNTEYYTYYDPDRGSHFKYYPDFIVNNNTIIEIKGYKTKLDNYKASGIIDKMVKILYKEDLLEIFNYVKIKYKTSIENLFQLYTGHATYIKKCEICLSEYETHRKSKRFCSRKCTGKNVAKIRHNSMAAYEGNAPSS